jgi:hypothetical protein
MKKILLFSLLVLCLAIPLNADQQDAGHFGYCTLCGEQIRSMSDGKPLSNYREVKFWMSNESDMRVALCNNCKEKLTETDYPKIMDGVRAGWMQEINNKKWKPKRILSYKERFFNITILKRIE